MPELPEVETMCRGIRSIVGATVRQVSRPRCRFRPIAMEPQIGTIRRRLRGRRITEISRLGKRVLIHADSEVLILQPKMTGLVSLADVPDQEHVRLVIELDNFGKPSGGSQQELPGETNASAVGQARVNFRQSLQFWDRRGLGTVELLRADEIERRIVSGRLGPDALSISVAELRASLARTSRPIKVALLDQKLLAGVGNLYASEILHQAGIDPMLPANALTARRIGRMHSVMLQILSKAIEYEGSTLSDGTYRNALNSTGGYQNHHIVYDRAGELCSSCGRAEIERIVQAQRSTFYCPKCQK